MQTSRTVSATVLLVSVLLCLAGCGGGGDGESTSSGSSTTAEGLWLGTTTTARTVTGIVLDTGSFWFLYSLPNNSSIIAGGVQGTSSFTNGTFSSSDARDFNLEGAGINNATIAGNYAVKQSLNGTITYPSLNQAIGFNSVYDPAYELAPSLANIAGSYTGTASVLGGTENATVTISQTGSLSGVGSSGCTFTGTVAPRAKGNVYDVVVTFGGGVCSNGNSTVTGIGYFDAGAKRLYSAAVNSTRTNGFIYVGTVSSATANLASLSVTGGTLNPSFDPNVTNYGMDVGGSVASITVTATVPNPGNTVIHLQLPNNQILSLNSGQTSPPIQLMPGVNQIALTVDTLGISKTYTIRVNRGANANLQSLQVSAGALMPAFSPDQTSYTVETGFSTPSTTVTATVVDPTATMRINGNLATSGQSFGPITLNVGSNNVIIIRVTATNGMTKDYQITVLRTGSSTLASLSASAGPIAPAFDPNTLAYTVSTDFTTQQTTINASTADSTAAVTVNGQGPVQGGGTFGPFGLAIGQNVFAIVVTSPTVAPKTYTVTVTRQPPSTNATLSNLTVSPGSLQPSFSAGTLSYTVNVDSNVSSVMVTATPADANASVSINGANGSSQTIPLNPAGTPTAITILVRAQDTVTTIGYSITVNR